MKNRDELEQVELELWKIKMMNGLKEFLKRENEQQDEIYQEGWSKAKVCGLEVQTSVPVSRETSCDCSRDSDNVEDFRY